MRRPDVLEQARKAVTSDRQATHGAPEDTFPLIAALWTAYLDEEISPTQVAVMMTLLKIARQRMNPTYDDNYVDIAGYAACAGELAERIRFDLKEGVGFDEVRLEGTAVIEMSAVE